MIPKLYAVVMLAAVALVSASPVPAAPVPASVRAPATAQGHYYSLEQVRLADASPVTYFWEVRQTEGPYDSDTEPPMEVFPSLASADLREWVSHLPAHSQIIYTVGLEQALIRGDANKVVSAANAQTSDFHRFCQSKGVTFLLVEIAN